MRDTVLAADYQVLARSPDPMNVFAGSPALAGLPSGRLVATYEWFRHGPGKEKVPDQCEVLTSDDDGATWVRRAATDLMWASPFALGDTLYLIGNRRGSRDIGIARSDDGGQTWTPESVLFAGRYTNAPTSITFSHGRVYRAFETCTPGNSTWKSLLVAGDCDRNLLDPGAWRMSNHVPYPGTPEAFTQGMYPPNPPRWIPEDGWLEGNVVEVRGRLRIVLRVRMQGEATAGVCGICDVADDGRTLTNRFAQFHPMPGGQCKFHIVRDEADGLFWTTTTPATDAFQPPDPLWDRGFRGSPGNERRVLVLMYSRDALNWFMAGVVAISADPLESFSYASQLIRGDDMLILSRTSAGGKDQHDTNLITLHRVEGFRELVPPSFMPDAGGQGLRQ